MSLRLVSVSLKSAVMVGSMFAVASLAACRPAASTSPAGASATEPASSAAPASDGDAAASEHKFVLGAIDAPEPVGSLDKNDIRNVVRSNIADIRGCYNQGLASDPKLAGRVTVQFAIGPDGAVAKSVVEASDLPASAASVAECIAAAARGWRFPQPEGGGSVIVSYPFVLEPGETATSPSGLASGAQDVGAWFAVSGFSPRTLVVELLDPQRRAAPGREVILRVYTRDAEERREAVTDSRGRAVFAGLPAEGSATAVVEGESSGAGTSSTAVTLGEQAQATILLLRAPRPAN